MERQRLEDQEQYVAQAQVLPESFAALMSQDELAAANQRYVQMHAAIEPLRTRGPKRFIEKREPIPYQMAESLARRSYLGATPEDLAREIYGSDEREFVYQIKSRLSNLRYALFDVGSRMTIDVLPERNEDNNKKQDRWYLRYRTEEPLSRTEYLDRNAHRETQDEGFHIEHEPDKQPEIREPYDYQMQCLQKLNEARANDQKRGLVVMATGTGKTAVAAFDTREAIEGVDAPRVLYVCHQADILTRAQETFEEVLGDQYTYGFYHGKSKADIGSTNVMFATFQTLGRNLDKFPADYFDYVVVDESHHSHAETYRPVVEHFKPGFMLGITATPDRADLLDIRDLFGEEVYSLPLERALAQGLLSKIDYRVMSANIDSKKLAKIKQLLERDITIPLLDRELFQPMAIEEVVERIQERLKEVENPHVMIFTPDVDECDKVAGMLEGAVSIHSKMNGERGNVVKALQEGEIDTAVSVDVFNEGIDIPRTNVLVFLRSTSSKTIFYQQLGRGLRKFDGKDSVLVLDFVGNCERIRMIQELAEGVKREGGKLRTSGTRTRGQNEINDIGDLDFEEISVDVMNLLGVSTRNQEALTEEQLIADLRNVAEKLGRSPTQKDIRQLAALGECAGAKTYDRRFGSHNKALHAAGLKTNIEFAKVRSNAELIEDLQMIFKELGKVPTQRDLDQFSAEKRYASASIYYTRFGSLNNALKVAGLNLNRKSYQNSDDAELIGYLEAISQELGRVPTTKDINRLSSEKRYPSVGIFAKKFGSFTKALQAAGLNVNKQESQAKDETEMIADLRTIYEELGRVPKMADINRLSREGRSVSAGTIERKFGSFNNALRAAGLSVNKERRDELDNQDLIEDLRSISEELGKVPSPNDVKTFYRKGRCVSVSSYCKRFGSWKNALRVAGFTSNQERRKSRQEEE